MGETEEPAIHEVSIEEGGTPRSLEVPEPAGRPWLVAVVVVVAVAGLGYGFLLGRGDRPGPPIASALSSTTTAATTTPTVRLGPFLETREEFLRTAPGHVVGRGVTEYLNPNQFQSLAVDEEGVIYAGGMNGVTRLDPTTGQFDRLTRSDGTGPLDVTAIAASPDGTVWVTTNLGFSQWDGEAWVRNGLFPRTFSHQTQVMALEVGPDGELWLATNTWAEGWSATARIHRLEDPYAGEMPAFTLDFDLQGMGVAADGTLFAVSGTHLWRYDGEWHDVAPLVGYWRQAMAIDRLGRIWLGGDGHLSRWDGSNLVAVPWGGALVGDLEAVGSDPEGSIQALAPGMVDDVWALATGWDSSALVHFEVDGYTRIPVPAGATAGPGGFVVGPDGTVWIAADTQLLRFDGEWQGFSMEEELPFTDPDSLAIGSMGELWIANDTEILQEDGDGWRRFGLGDLGVEPGDDSNSDRELWMTSAPDGYIWVGVGCRAFHLVAGDWHALPAPPELPDECHRMSVGGDSSGSLWMSPGCCSYSHPVYRWLGSEWSLLAEVRTHSDLTVAQDGSVWMTDDKGVNQFLEGEWEKVLEGVPVEDIVVSGEGEIWVAGANGVGMGGLWHYNGETWSLTRPSETFHSLTRGPDGGVWALQNQSDGTTDLLDVTGGHIRQVAGPGLTGAMAVAPDGTVWIGGEGRLYRVDPLF